MEKFRRSWPKGKTKRKKKMDFLTPHCFRVDRYLIPSVNKKAKLITFIVFHFLLCVKLFVIKWRCFGIEMCLLCQWTLEMSLRKHVTEKEVANTMICMHGLTVCNRTTILLEKAQKNYLHLVKVLSLSLIIISVQNWQSSQLQY